MVNVAKIWDTLEGTYGNAWAANWRGIERADVLQRMAELFAGLTEAQVEWALDNLPERVPSLPAFKKLAQTAPEKAALKEGYEWAWERLPLAGCPRAGHPTHRLVQAPVGTAETPLHRAPTEPPPLTLAQRARSMAYMAQTWAALGYHANADKARAECAELVELARDAGEQTPTAAALQDEAARSFAAAHARQLAEEKRGLTEPQRPQFDLAALLARRGTPKEDKRDWARIIAAKVERGANVGNYAVKKARQALEGYEGERWLQNASQRAQNVPAMPAPMPAAKSAPSARFDDAEDLPW